LAAREGGGGWEGHEGGADRCGDGVRTRGSQRHRIGALTRGGRRGRRQGARGRAGARGFGRAAI